MSDRQRPRTQEIPTAVQIRDWPGLVTAADRKDIPPGCGTRQVNLEVTAPGELAVRRGLRPVRFDS